MGLSNNTRTRIKRQAEALGYDYRYFRLLAELAPFYSSMTGENPEKYQSDNKALHQALMDAVDKFVHRWPGYTFSHLHYANLMNLDKLQKDFGKSLGLKKKDYLQRVDAHGSCYLINPYDYKKIAALMLKKTESAMGQYSMTTYQKTLGSVLTSCVIGQIVLFAMNAVPDYMIIPCSVILAVTTLRLMALGIEYKESQALMQSFKQTNIAAVNKEITNLRAKAEEAKTPAASEVATGNALILSQGAAAVPGADAVPGANAVPGPVI